MAQKRSYLSRAAILLGLTFVIVSVGLPQARAAPAKPKTVVVILEGIDFPQIGRRAVPSLRRLTSYSAIGLMSWHKVSAGADSPSAFFVTLAAGTTAAGLDDRQVYPVSAYMSLPARARLIASINEEKNTRAVVGALGTRLRREGLRTAAVGAIPAQQDELDFLDLVLDENGTVDRLISTSASDPSTFAGRIQDAYRGYNLVVADYRGNGGLKEADNIVGLVDKAVSPVDTLIVIAPQTHRGPEYAVKADLLVKGAPLSPVWIRGPRFSAGLLTSSTTRRSGVLSAGDFAPTVLNGFGIADSGAGRGAAYTVEFAGDRLAFLSDLSEKAERHDAFMVPALAFSAVLCFLALTLVLGAVRLGRETSVSRPLRAWLVATALLPLALSLAGRLDFSQSWQTVFFVAAVAALAGPITLLTSDRIFPLLIVFALSALLLVIDTFAGGPVVNHSLLGASLLVGGRYYGLGNPLVGVLIAFSALSAVLVSLRFPSFPGRPGFRIVTAAVFFLLLAAVGSGRWGANFGGLLTLAFSLPLFYLRLVRKRTSIWVSIMLIIVTGVLTIYAFSVYDVAQEPAGRSHVGTAIIEAEVNSAYIIAIMSGKMTRNLQDIFWIMIGRGGFLLLGLIAWLAWAVRPRLRGVFTTFPLFKEVLPGILLAAGLALLANDTGLQPFMIILFYTLVAALYLHLSTVSSGPSREAP